MNKYGYKVQLDLDSLKKARTGFVKFTKDLQSIADKNYIKIKLCFRIMLKWYSISQIRL